MGLDMTRDGKKIVCASATEYTDPVTKTNAVLIDVNAMFRKECIYTTADVTPRKAVDIFFRRHIFIYPECRYFGFYCDSPDRVPLERQKFLKTKRYAPSAKPPAENQIRVGDRNYTRGTEPVSNDIVAQITADSLPAAWPRLWNSSAGKAKLWNVIVECIQDKIMRFAAPDTTYVIEPQSGPVWSYPVGATQEHNFGEADAKCAEAAMKRAVTKPSDSVGYAHNFRRQFITSGALTKKRRLQVLIKTIDWDMLISGFFFPNNVKIHIGTVFYDRDSDLVAYSKKKASAKCERVPEIIQPARLSGNHCMSLAFWVLASSGVDYCEGLRAFGFKEAGMLARLADIKSRPFIVVQRVEGQRRSAEIDTRAFMEHLLSVKRYRATNDSLHDFMQELDSIWFCALYYAGFDSQRKRGGPVLKSHEWIVGGAKTLSEHIEMRHDQYQGLSYLEEHPDTVERYRRPTSHF